MRDGKRLLLRQKLLPISNPIIRIFHLDQDKVVKVITSGAFAAALKQLVPIYEKENSCKVDLSFGSSIGAAHDSIPTRLRNGERFDLFILASSALEGLISQGLIKKGSRVDLVSSCIGAAVRIEDKAPDISSVVALKNALLSAKSVAYSASASGTYISTELFQELGIAEEMKLKAKRIFSERVGTVLVRGEADLGFQQISELLPISGIKIIGELPPEVQRSFFFSAGTGAATEKENTVNDLVKFLASDAAGNIIRETGLSPVFPKLN